MREPQSASTQSGNANQEWGEWYEKIPQTIRSQIPDEALKEIQAGWMKEKDYRQKTQEVAAVKKLMDANPGMDWNQAVQALNWAKTEWPKWQASYTDLEARARAVPARREEPPPTNPNGGRRGKWVNEIAAEDFYETARLREKFAALEEEWIPAARDAAVKAIREDWYQKEELPRLDKVAANYLNTVIGLMTPLWHKVYGADAPDINALLKEAVARQSGDLPTVFDDMVKTRTGMKTSSFDEGYKKGIEEAEAKAKAAGGGGGGGGGTQPGSSGPLSGTTPAWKAPENKAPKNRADVYANVLKTVEAKHGPLPGR